MATHRSPHDRSYDAMASTSLVCLLGRLEVPHLC